VRFHVDAVIVLHRSYHRRHHRTIRGASAARIDIIADDKLIEIIRSCPRRQIWAPGARRMVVTLPLNFKVRESA